MTNGCLLKEASQEADKDSSHGRSWVDPSHMAFQDSDRMEQQNGKRAR